VWGKHAIQPCSEVLRLLFDRSDLSARKIAEIMIKYVFTEDFIKGNRELIEFLIQQMVRAPISKEAFSRQVDAIMRFDAYDRLSQIRAPTLVVQGKRDIIMPPENALILANGIPNAKLVYFENSAHGLAEEIDKLISLLLSFLCET